MHNGRILHRKISLKSLRISGVGSSYTRGQIPRIEFLQQKKTKNFSSFVKFHNTSTYNYIFSSYFFKI